MGDRRQMFGVLLEGGPSKTGEKGRKHFRGIKVKVKLFMCLTN
jgi:hypothetical protein